MRIALIAGKDTSTCFKLAGLKDVYSVTNAEEAEKRLNDLLSATDLAIILVAERFIDQIGNMTAQVIERGFPIIVPIPDMLGPAVTKTDFIVDLVRRKAGIEVKL